MQRDQDALFSKYVIDGVRQDVTPAEMLDECMLPSDVDDEKPVGECAEIWDEDVDLPPENLAYSKEDIPIYIRRVKDLAPASQDREFISGLEGVAPRNHHCCVLALIHCFYCFLQSYRHIFLR